MYATGRSVESQSFPSDGRIVAIRCDHTRDAQVEAVFDRVAHEQHRLDILVNNVWGGYEEMFEDGEFTWTRPFWQQQFSRWDSMFSSGVRAHYVASCFAARQMVEQGRGLIVNISYWAARKHIANVPYGVSKAATDKMTADMAHELEEHGVAVVSLYPGLVRTEKVMESADYLDLGNSESPRFIGRAVEALAADPNVLDQSGSVVIAAACAASYGFKDIDGKQPTPLTLDQS